MIRPEHGTWAQRRLTCEGSRPHRAAKGVGQIICSNACQAEQIASAVRQQTRPPKRGGQQSHHMPQTQPPPWPPQTPMSNLHRRQAGAQHSAQNTELAVQRRPAAPLRRRVAAAFASCALQNRDSGCLAESLGAPAARCTQFSGAPQRRSGRAAPARVLACIHHRCGVCSVSTRVASAPAACARLGRAEALLVAATSHVRDTRVHEMTRFVTAARLQPALWALVM